ncbi:MAG: DUF86 domain-containing protein [Patescibacteria group bacterium]
MNKNLLVYVQDIKSAIAHIKEYSRGLTLEDLAKDDLRLDGIIRRLLIIGEAARRFPDEVRSANPNIPWADIIGTRNVLVHDYDAIKPEQVMKILSEDIPVLTKHIEVLGEKLEKGSL